MIKYRKITDEIKFDAWKQTTTARFEYIEAFRIKCLVKAFGWPWKMGEALEHPIVISIMSVMSIFMIAFLTRNILQHSLSWWLLALIASIQYSLYLTVALTWFMLCRIIPRIYRYGYSLYVWFRETFTKASVGL